MTSLRVVHLPVYDDNRYQSLLMVALRERGVEAVTGGGAWNYCRGNMMCDWTRVLVVCRAGAMWGRCGI